MPATLSTLFAKPEFTEVVEAKPETFGISERTRAVESFKAILVAKLLKSWSPVLVPVIAASFVFSAVE